jgi:hypothetical protein
MRGRGPGTRIRLAGLDPRGCRLSNNLQRIPIVKRLIATAVLSAALLLPGAVSAQQGAGDFEFPPEFIQALQKEVGTLRMDAMQSTIQLEAGEASTFWAIYEQYLIDLENIVGGRAELIRDYIVQFNEMSDDQATAMGQRAIEMRMDQMALTSRYFDRIAKEVSGLTAAQFYQIENQVQMLIDLRLAMELPIIGRR